MKLHPALVPAVLALASPAHAAVTPVGVDATTGANWRTAAAFDTDGMYGTSGYVIFGLNAADAVYTQPFDVTDANDINAYALPADITLSTVDTNLGMWSGNGNFGQMQDPVSGALTAAPVLANSNGQRQFILARSASAAYRITFLTASGDNEGTEYSLSVDDGSGAATTTYDHIANGLAYHVFDVTAGSTDIVIDISTSAQNRSLTGIAFDPVPATNPPPQFTVQPASQSAVAGGPVTFSATAAGGNVTLQWQRNSAPILGATAPSYTLATTATTDNGAEFRCVATNGSDSVPSEAATLTVVAPSPQTAAYRAATAVETSRLAFFPFDGDSGETIANALSATNGGTLQSGGLSGNPARVVGSTALSGAAALTADPEWEFPDESGTVEAFLYQSAAAPYNPCFFSIRESASNVRISLHGGAAGDKLYFWNGAAVAIWTPPVNTIGRRSHVAFVFEAGNVTAYFDGQSLGTQAVALGTGLGAGLPAQIGAADPSNTELWVGTVDEVVLYSEPLAGAAIAAHATAWYGSRPVLSAQPQPTTVVEKSPARFAVAALGQDLTYQWERNGLPIDSATEPSLRFITAASDAGAEYRCVVTNLAGSVISDAAVLTVVPLTTSPAAYRAAVNAEASLLAYFPFDGDLGPAVTNAKSAANGGTVRADGFLSGGPGRTVGTTALIGSAGLVADPSWEFSDESGTVEAFVFQSAPAGDNPCLFSIRDTTGVRYSLHGATDGSKFFLWNGSAVTVWNAAKNTIDRLSHVAFVFDAGNVTAYQDGVSLGTQSNTLGAGTGLSVQIGSSTETSAELWPGTVDEVAIYDEALSADALSTHASAWFGVVAAPDITAVTASSGLLFITMNSLTGHTYALETSPDLVTPWTAVEGSSQPGTGNPLTLSVPMEGAASFHRVRVTR